MTARKTPVSGSTNRREFSFALFSVDAEYPEYAAALRTHRQRYRRAGIFELEGLNIPSVRIAVRHV